MMNRTYLITIHNYFLMQINQ